MTTPADAPAPPGAHRRSAVELLAVLAPVSVLAALFFFFGYLSTQAFFLHFGVTLSALDMTSETYGLWAAAMLPRQVRGLVLVPLVLLLLLVLHGVAVARLRTAPARRARVAGHGLMAAGSCALLVALVWLPAAGLRDQLVPVLLGAGALLVEYGLGIASRCGGPRSRVVAVLTPSPALRRGLLAALVVTCLLWVVALRAYESGTSQARLVETTLRGQPSVVVHSEHDVHLAGPGVRRTLLGSASHVVRYRYTGLHVLAHADGQWFLLPAGWTRDGGGSVLVLPTDPRVRVDLAPARRAP